MRRALLSGLMLMLAACATTPDQLRQDGKSTTLDSQRTPMQTASCIATNMERFNADLVGNIREAVGQPGTLELTVRWSGDVIITWLVAEIAANGSGSTAKIWSRRGAETSWLNDATKDC